MSERLSFTTRASELIEFDVDGEVFHIAPIGGWAFFDLAEMVASAADAGDANSVEKMAADAAQAVKVKSLFRDHMTPEEFERFDKFCRSPRGPDLGLLMQMIEGIVGQTAGVPTQPPSSSDDGRQTTGDGSTASASSPVSISAPSPSTEG